jgi:thiamine biosynthesis lipoprotein ApbE
MMSAAVWGADTAQLGRALDAVRDTVDRPQGEGRAGFDSLRRDVRRRTGVTLAFADIAEGDALDRAAVVLRGLADSALLDLGGQFLWIGPRDTRRMVGIADPASSLRALATVELRAGSVSTSSHPRGTGGAGGGTRSVTVLAPSGIAADAWSTALLTVGCDSALAGARRLQRWQVSVVCADSGRVRWTADLDGRVVLPKGARVP